MVVINLPDDQYRWGLRSMEANQGAHVVELIRSLTSLGWIRRGSIVSRDLKSFPELMCDRREAFADLYTSNNVVFRADSGRLNQGGGASLFFLHPRLEI